MSPLFRHKYNRLYAESYILRRKYTGDITSVRVLSVVVSKAKFVSEKLEGTACRKFLSSYRAILKRNSERKKWSFSIRFCSCLQTTYSQSCWSNCVRLVAKGCSLFTTAACYGCVDLSLSHGNEEQIE